MTDVLLCVGNSMMGDDGAGPLLAEMCAANPVGDWVVIDGGSAPENDIVAIRELRPERLLIVDATDMGLNPGEIRIVDPDDIAEMFMMTTHNMPLNYLIDQLKEDIGEVIFLGIQPDIVGFYYPMTQPIKDAVEAVYARLDGWQGQGGLRHLKPQRSRRSPAKRSASREFGQGEQVYFFPRVAA
ncbi:Coenzyme F420 hydrogenase maturation protease [Klebsiella oxytoca]|nr:Coenzyme F420 hydrogenase maturation protease [Klebsiella oxytoca]